MVGDLVRILYILIKRTQHTEKKIKTHRNDSGEEKKKTTLIRKEKKTFFFSTSAAVAAAAESIKNVLNEMKECDQNPPNTDRFLYLLGFFFVWPLKKEQITCFSPLIRSSFERHVCVGAFYFLSHYEFYERFRLSAT